MPPLSKEAALAIYKLLIAEAEAHPHYQSHFIHSFTSDEPPREWRFQGTLGFGGKFYRDGTRWRVGCYREDDTPERQATIDTLNIKLAELRQTHEDSLVRSLE